MPKNAASNVSGGVRLETTGEQNRLNWFIDTLSGLVWTALPDGSIDLLNRGWQHGWHAAIRHPG